MKAGTAVRSVIDALTKGENAEHFRFTLAKKSWRSVYLKYKFSGYTGSDRWRCFVRYCSSIIFLR
jgi:hypothetical protein